MNTINKIIVQFSFFALTLLLFTSCEDIIVLDLEEAAEQYVIEANLNASDSSCRVKLSKTNTYYETNDFELIEGASIVLNLSNGNTYTLSEGASGNYAVSGVEITPGDLAELSVSLLSGESFSAESRCPNPTTLDSLTLVESPLPMANGGSQLLFHFQDPVNELSYYRVKAWKDQESVEGYYLYDDENQDGAYLTLPLFGTFFESGEMIRLQLMTVSEEYYNYFVQIQDVQTEGANAATPYNPKGNFGDGVLGNFGIYYSSSLQIEVP
jgi:hypothetical protein